MFPRNSATAEDRFAFPLDAAAHLVVVPYELIKLVISFIGR